MKNTKPAHSSPETVSAPSQNTSRKDEDAVPETSPQNTSMDESVSSGTPSQKERVRTADKVKFFGLILFIVLLILVGIAIFPYFEQLATDEGRLQLIESIKEAGIAGIGICLGLQFVQIVVAFIPGEITQIAIGVIYGPLAGTAITTLGALISSIFVFFVVRKLGAPFVQGMIGTKNSKVLNFINKDRRLNAIVFILYLIPGLPKDAFTYLFPLTHIRPINFFVLSTLGRIPAIVASAFFGNAAIQGDYIEAIVIGVIAGGLGLLGIIFNSQIIEFVDKIESHFTRNKRLSK